jgi:hypothetical protein
VARRLPLLYAEVTNVVNQCGILFIGPCGQDGARLASLRSLGFRVDESAQVPPQEELAGYHAVIVRVVPRCSLTMLGARLRATPLFGRRALIAFVSDAVSDRDRREATMGGFDQTLPDNCPAREVAAQILRLLRNYPEYRCLLRTRNGRRKAA